MFTFSEFQIIESILKHKYVNKVKETFFSFLSNFFPLKNSGSVGSIRASLTGRCYLNDFGVCRNLL